jgi:hypothetical protein
MHHSAVITPLRCPISWTQKLKYLLQTLLFSLCIAGAQYAFHPDLGFEVPLVYSLGISLSTWALIDFGRHAFASAAQTGWPQGMAAMALPLAGMALGYVLGTLVADHWFGWSSWGQMGRVTLPVSVGITAISGTLICYYFYAKSKTAFLETAMAEARQQASEARLKLLESQLEPHMLFNTLANLRALIGSDPARAQTILDHLNGYLRATLSASRSAQASHTLAQEFERLRDYLELMRIRMGARLQYTLDLPEPLGRLAVPPLLLQPLVENSIRHGLEPKVAGGSIRITARQTGERVTIEVVDSGLGFDLGTEETDGFGLSHVRERLATLHADRANLRLSALVSGGTSALITLPSQP